MAHKKGTGSTRNGRDSNAQRLGVKLFGGQLARPGSILVRQRGTKFHPGINVRRGRDDTLYSVRYGIVQFERFGKKRKRINVQPFPEVADKQMSYQDAYRTYRASVDVASHRVSADDASDVASTAEEDMEDDMQKQLVQKVAAQFKQSAARKTDIGKLHSHSNSTNQNIRLERGLETLFDGDQTRIRQWLSSNNFELNDRKPNEFIEAGKIWVICDLIDSILDGTPV